MNINKDIFKEYDVRGVYPNEINEEAVNEIARAFVSYLDKAGAGGKIVIGSDIRLSSPELKKAFIKGCVESGREVVDIGVITTPAMYFAVNLLKAAGGAIITASHNPPEYNGVKLTLSNTDPLSPSEIFPYLETESPNVRIGSVEKIDILPAYTDFLSSFAEPEIAGALQVVADASNGSGGAALKALFEKIGIAYRPLYFEPDGRYPNHSPNPLLKEAQQKAKELVIHKGADFGFVLDADGDRIVFLDEKGKLVNGDLIMALFINELLQGGDAAIVNASASKIVEDVGRERGVNVVRARTGHTNIKKSMRKHGAKLGGEVSGHYYFKDFFGADSALMALVKFLNILAKSRKSFSSLVERYSDEPYREYFHSREYNFKIADREENALKILGELKEKYQDGKQSELDGLTVEYPDWWFNVRPSHTEPVMRLNIEVDKKTLLREKIEELTGFINSKL